MPTKPTARDIVVDLTRKIEPGERSPGSRLPPARALAESYGVALTTVQRATLVLRERGLVVGQPGRGFATVGL